MSSEPEGSDSDVALSALLFSFASKFSLGQSTYRLHRPAGMFPRAVR